MAKNKINFGLITKIVVLVLCVVTAISFFLPVFGSKEANYKFSNCQVCFLSEERASEKAQEYGDASSAATLEGDTAKAERLFNKAVSYELVSNVKNKDFDGRTAAVTGAWFHFVAMVASVVAIVFIALTLFGKDFAKISMFATIASVIFMIVALICGISFLGTKVGSTTVGEDFAFRFGGVILGLITSVLAGVTSFIPCLVKKKKS